MKNKDRVIFNALAEAASIEWIEREVARTCSEIDFNDALEYSPEKEEKADFLQNRLTYLVGKSKFELRNLGKNMSSV